MSAPSHYRSRPHLGHASKHAERPWQGTSYHSKFENPHKLPMQAIDQWKICVEVNQMVDAIMPMNFQQPEERKSHRRELFSNGGVDVALGARSPHCQGKNQSPPEMVNL